MSNCIVQSYFKLRTHENINETLRDFDRKLISYFLMSTKFEKKRNFEHFRESDLK